MTQVAHRHRTRYRVRNRRRLKLILLCVGLTGLALSVALAIFSFFASVAGRRILFLAAAYLAASLVVLVVRQLLVAWTSYTKKRYSRPVRYNTPPHARRAAPAMTAEEPPRPVRPPPGGDASAGKEAG
jgi:hypothetical protein